MRVVAQSQGGASEGRYMNALHWGNWTLWRRRIYQVSATLLWSVDCLAIGTTSGFEGAGALHGVWSVILVSTGLARSGLGRLSTLLAVPQFLPWRSLTVVSTLRGFGLYSSLLDVAPRVSSSCQQSEPLMEAFRAGLTSSIIDDSSGRFQLASM